jgi:hypothetical protein
MEVVFSLENIICSVADLLYVNSNKGGGLQLHSYAMDKPIISYHEENQLK